MLGCRRYSDMVASGAYEEAGVLDRLGAQFHFFYCWRCRKYVKQIRAIGTAARSLWGGEMSPDEARIVERVRTALPTILR